MGRPVRSDQVVALAKAARLLHDLGVAWSPKLMQVLHDPAPDIGADDHSDTDPAEDNTVGSPDIHGLWRLLNVFRREKEQP